MRDERDEWVQFDNVTVYADTDKAMLCDIDGTRYWIPKSQMRAGTDIA